MASLNRNPDPETKRATLELLENFVSRTDLKTFCGHDYRTEPDCFITLWWNDYTESKQVTVISAEGERDAVSFNVSCNADPITFLNEVICALIRARPGMKPSLCMTPEDAAEWTGRDQDQELARMNRERIDRIQETLQKD